MPEWSPAQARSFPLLHAALVPGGAASYLAVQFLQLLRRMSGNRTEDRALRPKGNATATTSFRGPVSPDKWYVAIHQGPKLSSKGGTKLVACGNVT